VHLLSVEVHVLHINNVDIKDENPIQDIKPYVPAFDVGDLTEIGWLKGNIG
jgi:tRNA (Thr-GGU) A37 N-methylase